MANNLDDRYVDYDLNTAIGVLPTTNGGTGENVVTPGMVMVSEALGGGGVKITASSAITATELNALNGISNASTIENRLAPIETHVSSGEIHVPSTTLTNRYLNSNGTGSPAWVQGMLAPVPAAGDSGKFLQATGANASAWQTITFPSGGVNCILTPHLSNLLTIGTSEVTVMTQSVATGGGDPHFIASVMINAWPETNLGGGDTGYEDLVVRIRRDGTIVFSATLVAPNINNSNTVDSLGSFTFHARDTAATGTHSYTVTVEAPGWGTGSGNNPARVTHRSMMTFI